MSHFTEMLKSHSNIEHSLAIQNIHDDYNFNIDYLKKRFHVPLSGHIASARNIKKSYTNEFIDKAIKKSNTNEFIDKAIKKHEHKYNYSETNYVNSKTKVIIICQQHGKFSQMPHSHLKGKEGCKECNSNKKMGKTSCNTQTFIEKATNIHKDKYDYSRTEYVDTYAKVAIVCPIREHGVFYQTPSNHLHKRYECPHCGGSHKSNTNEFIDKAIKKHNNTYNYSKVEYIGAHYKIIIICKVHGEFYQTPNKHLSGQECKRCYYEKLRL